MAYVCVKERERMKRLIFFIDVGVCVGRLERTVWCSVLQCVSTCCSVLRCVAVCCSVLQCVAVCGSVWQCVAVCCSVGVCENVWF